MKSATQNHDTTYAGMSFKDAVQAVMKAWRKKYGYRLPPPEISHALSTYDEGTWVLRSSETGEIAAIIIDGSVMLAEDLRDAKEI